MNIYGINSWNTSDNLCDTYNYKINCLRKSADIHKQARKYLQKCLKPNMSYRDICQTVENKVEELFLTCYPDDKDKGMGFPVGISANDIVAHDSCNIIDDRKISKNDIIKIDFGTHYNGYIIDSAFSVYFDNKFDNLAKATHEATCSTIKMVGVDMLVSELSKNIQEIIESYEIELDGKIYPIKSVKNLGGHNIEQYKIHGGTLILNGFTPINPTVRIKEDTIYAIETFATTGKGYVVENNNLETNHFMMNDSNKKARLIFDVSKNALNWIKKERKTLPFANRWVQHGLQNNKANSGINELVKNGIVQKYPPLVEIKNSFSSQYEHTIYVSDKSVENLSISDDY